MDQKDQLSFANNHEMQIFSSDFPRGSRGRLDHIDQPISTLAYQAHHCTALASAPLSVQPEQIRITRRDTEQFLKLVAT